MQLVYLKQQSKYNMKLELTVLAVVVASVFGAPLETSQFTGEDWHLVPQLDGTFRYMHNSELQVVEEKGFDPVKEIVFYLYTRANGATPQKIKFRNIDSLLISDFNPKHETKFLIHGWQADYKSAIIKKLAAAYIEHSDFNVIGVDWSGGSSNILYNVARNRVGTMAKVVAQMVDFLVENGQTMKQMSVIGHSLGGQGAGIVGKLTTYGKLHTIVALDPAGPLFSLKETSERVTEDDAEYVEIIHSNGGKLGFWDPIGQADFYPNGGYNQPGCGLDLSGSCAHGRAVEYFIESINANYFLSTNCASMAEISAGKCTSVGPYLPMGGYPSNHGAGDGYYYVKTNTAMPYAIGRSQ